MSRSRTPPSSRSEVEVTESTGGGGGVWIGVEWSFFGLVEGMAGSGA